MPVDLVCWLAPTWGWLCGDKRDEVRSRGKWCRLFRESHVGQTSLMKVFHGISGIDDSGGGIRFIDCENASLGRFFLFSLSACFLKWNWINLAGTDWRLNIWEFANKSSFPSEYLEIVDTFLQYKFHSTSEWSHWVSKENAVIDFARGIAANSLWQ